MDHPVILCIRLVDESAHLCSVNVEVHDRIDQVVRLGIAIHHRVVVAHFGIDLVIHYFDLDQRSICLVDLGIEYHFYHHFCQRLSLTQVL